MEYPDFPFPEKSKTFLTHEDVFGYLKDYCAHFDLRRSIKFKTIVKHILPSVIENNGTTHKSSWRVTSVDESNMEVTSEFHSVVICNG